MIAWRSTGNNCWMLVDTDVDRHPSKPYCLAKIELIGNRWFGLIYPNDKYHIRPSKSVHQMMNRCTDALQSRETMVSSWLRAPKVDIRDTRDTPREPRLYKLCDIYFRARS